MRERRVGDGDGGARTRSPIWDRREVEEAGDWRYMQAQRFSGSVSAAAEPERFRGTGSTDRRDYDRRRDDGDRDRDGRLWKQVSNAQFSERVSPSMKFQWNQLLEKEPLNGSIVNPNLNSNLNPNSRFVDANVNVGSILDSEYRHVGGGGGGFGLDSAEKGFRGSHLSDMTVLPRQISMDNDRSRTYSSNLMKTYGFGDTGFGDSNMNLWRSPNHPLHSDNRALYKQEEKLRYYAGQSSPYETPISQFHNTSSNKLRDDNYGVYEDGLSVPSDGARRGSGMLTETSHDGYGQTSHFVSSANSDLQLNRLVDQQRALPSPVEEMDRGYAYPDVQISERSDIGMLSNGRLYSKMANCREDCGRQEFVRTSVVDSIVDRIDGTGSSPRGSVRDSVRLHQHRTLQEQYEYIDEIHENIGSYTSERHGDTLGSRSTHIEYETEDHIDLKSLQEDYDLRRDVRARFYEDRILMSDYDQDLYETEGIPRHMLMSEELGTQDIYNNMLTSDDDISNKASRHNQNIKSYHNGGAFGSEFHSQSYGDEQWADDIIDQAYTDNDMLSSIDALASMQDPSFSFINSAGRDVKNRLGPPAGRDIKKRLGPPPGRDIKKRLGPPRRDIKKRLGPVGGDHKKHPRIAHVQYPWLRKPMEHKCVKRNIDDCHVTDSTSVADTSEVKAEHGKTVERGKRDSPEDSEEFKQLVHGTFLKFVKLLNESSAHRRRYMEQRGNVTLKCGICGRNSKEFMDTKSLAQHAFQSRMVGFRAEHLGFHKALCALMGWNSAAASDCSWSPQSLTDAEVVSLKEDLIIWPPTIIIHNSSIASNIPDERMIISIEELEAILRGMGFGGDKTKVCRGKPANQSIMVVTFPGTFSGLQEAEKFHKFYAENSHGRAELQQVTPTSIRGKTEKSEAESKVENVLYGYLGVAGDLDKLDFESKKRCVVKSKKEIEGIADAS